MRIIIHDYAGHAFPIDLSRELARRGHTVVHAYASNLVTPRGDLRKRPSDSPSLCFKELEMAPEYPKVKYSFVKRRRLELNYARLASTWINDLKPDVVISGNTPTEVQYKLIKAAHRSDAFFINWIQDLYGLAVDKLIRKKLGPLGLPIGFYYRWLDNKIIRASDHIITITEDFIPFVIAAGASQLAVTTVPNWAILDEITEQPKSNVWAIDENLHESFVFLYTGTLGMKHNPAMLVALAKHFADRPRVKVVVVSEGQGANWLADAKASEALSNIVVLPYQDFQSLPNVLATGDVLIAILEPDAGLFSVPSKVLSYVCAGRALLVAIPPENLAAKMVSSSKSGIVVPPADVGEFLISAEKLYQDSSTRTTMAKNARIYAEENFRIREIADKFDQILATINVEKANSGKTVQ